MRHIVSLDELHLERSWVTVGTFDGVHRGHQEIIRNLTAGAHAIGAPAVVLTFHPHPAEVVRGRIGDYYLTLPEERAALLGEQGVDVVVTHPFNKQVAALTAHEFVERMVEHLGMRQLWVGHDFALGKGREGNVPRLHELGEEMGFQVQEVDAIQVGGEVVSSSRIRSLLLQGEVKAAAHLLSRPYQLRGMVIAGDQRGRTIGIPTANLQIPAGKLIPAAGVYAGLAQAGSHTYGAAVNIGVRPTFDGGGTQVHVEAHLLDFEGDLYGQVLSVELIDRLRGEQRFASIDALVTQIRADIERTREIVALHF